MEPLVDELERTSECKERWMEWNWFEKILSHIKLLDFDLMPCGRNVDDMWSNESIFVQVVQAIELADDGRK